MSGALAQIVADAVSLGGLYALTALGIGLIFGVMRLINFAHGDLIGAAGYALLLASGQPLAAALFCALAAAVAVALATERLAFRPLRRADPATLLIASFAVSMFLEKLLIVLVGARPKGIDLLPSLAAEVTVAGVRLQRLQLVTIGASLAMLLAVSLFLRFTRLGLQMRAAAENFRMARLLGVRANRVIAAAFALSGALAAVVAVLFVAQTGVVAPRMGLTLVVIAFVATVVGGLGSLAGAAAGGALVGLDSVLLQAFLPDGMRPFREAFVFLAVIVVLLFRPQGLFAARGLRQRA